MHRSFTNPKLPLLVFTDLDGTLLDHDDYSFEPAAQALRELTANDVPLIPTTSKTLAEVAHLNREQLGNPHPCIVENGAVLCIPQGYFSKPVADEVHSGYQLLRLARPYSQVVAVLNDLRRSHGYRFEGFNDMSCNAVARATGLDRAAAARARQRLSGEPLLWHDSDNALASFGKRLAAQGLKLTRGGRFWHVMGGTDKARAMLKLCDLYRSAGFDEFNTVALGDSPNDAEMLEAADVAVVVRVGDGRTLDVQGRRRTIRTAAPGPTGWSAAMQMIINGFGASAPGTQLAKQSTKPGDRAS